MFSNQENIRIFFLKTRKINSLGKFSCPFQSASNVSWISLGIALLLKASSLYYICKEKQVNLNYSACHKKR